MKNVRLLASLLALVMSVSILAACGDTETTVSSEGGTSSTASLPSINISSVGAPSNTVSLPEPAEAIVLVEKGAEFQCKTLNTADFNTFIAENPTWKDAGYDVSEWQTANAPLGDRIGSSPIGWGGWDQEPHGLLCVTKFNVENLDELADTEFYMNIFYDNTIYVYINGNLVFSHDGQNADGDHVNDPDWVDNYTDIDFTESINQYLVEGENTLAISLLDGWGGRELDLAILGK